MSEVGLGSGHIRTIQAVLNPALWRFGFVCELNVNCFHGSLYFPARPVTCQVHLMTFLHIAGKDLRVKQYQILSRVLFLYP